MQVEMINLYMSLLVGSLFYLLSPGILLRFPKNGSKMTVAATHAVIFAILYYFIHNIMWNFVNEGFKDVQSPVVVQAKGSQNPQVVVSQKGVQGPVVVPAKGSQNPQVVVPQKKAGFADYY